MNLANAYCYITKGKMLGTFRVGLKRATLCSTVRANHKNGTTQLASVCPKRTLRHDPSPLQNTAEEDNSLL